MLRDPDVSTDKLEEVRKELHGIVLGMGGLFDLHLMPTASSKLSRLEATKRLEALADRLYILTK